jgi:L-threonylcarbamoyladenylate synthase
MILAPDSQGIKNACHLLKKGKAIGMPTETVYGLAADACNDAAIAEIYKIKNRPTFNPLIIHVDSQNGIETLACVSSTARILMNAFWPGPLTLVLRRAPDCPVSLLAGAGLDTIALRCPAHPVARELIQAFERPLAAPSANLSMEISPTCAKDVAASLHNKISLILDGGSCDIGLESTIIDLSGSMPVLLRPGGISMETLQKTIGHIELPANNTKVRAPGMLARHYAPQRPLRLDAQDCQPGEALLGFGATPVLNPVQNLSISGNLGEAAANLFRMMRQLDREPYKAIAVMPIPEKDLGVAINDRLRRAATPLT